MENFEVGRNGLWFFIIQSMLFSLFISSIYSVLNGGVISPVIMSENFYISVYDILFLHMVNNLDGLVLKADQFYVKCITFPSMSVDLLQILMTRLN